MTKASKILAIGVFSLFCIGLILGLNPTTGHCEKIEISLANDGSPFFVYTIVSKEFKKLVEEKVGDKVTVKVYPSGQLGGEKDTLEGMNR